VANVTAGDLSADRQAAGSSVPAFPFTFDAPVPNRPARRPW